MYASTGGSTPSRPFLMRLLVRSSEYRHARTWARIRIACALFNLGLGGLLLSFGFWVGAVSLVGARLLFWTAHHLQQSVSGQAPERQPA